VRTANRDLARDGRATPRRVAARCAGVAILASLSACAAPEGSIALDRWELTLDGREARAVTLPAHLDDVPGHDLEYRLTTRFEVPDDLAGETLELTIPHLAAQVTLLADGRPIEARERDESANYRRRGPQHFEIPAELSRDGQIALELAISHRWSQSAWFDIAPRIAAHPEGRDVWDRVAFVNGPLTLACLGSLLTVGLTYLLVYLGDRRRKTHLWLGVQALAGGLYPAFAFGVLQPVFGRYDAAVVMLGLTAALGASLYFTHSLCSLPSPPRPLLAVLGATALITLATTGPYVLTLVGARFVVISVALVLVYQLARCSQLVLNVAHARKDAAWLLFAWIALGLTAWPDLAYWFGLGDFVSGLRPASIGLIVFALVLLLHMSRNHTISLSQGEELNTALTRQIETLEHRQGEIERLNEELRHQVSDRSEQLFVALAAVATGVRAKHPEPGSVLNDRYRLTRPLGEGGMGTVFEVERLRDGARLAAKFPTESKGIALARLAREAHVASMVVHHNVIRIHDVDFLPSGHLYFIMELADGGTLRDRHAEYRRPWLATVVLAEVARGLEALHAHGIVHRDVKPTNVVFARARERLVAKLTDFGISRPSLAADERTEHAEGDGPGERVDAESSERPSSLSVMPGSPLASRSPPMPTAAHESVEAAEDVTPLLPGAVGTTTSGSERPPEALTMAGLIAGTPTYMAPEIAARPGAFSPPSDMFSFGVLAYELLLGASPFVEPPARAVAEGREPSLPLPIDADARAIPRALVALVEACLSFDPAARPTASEAAERLEAIAGDDRRDTLHVSRRPTDGAVS
jgi:serine/threonine protein kinase